MPEVGFTNLLVVCVIALLAPLALGFAPRVRVPAVVLEIVAGVVVGPSVLGWVEVGPRGLGRGGARTRLPALPGRARDRRPPAARSGAAARAARVRRHACARPRGRRRARLLGWVQQPGADRGCLLGHLPGAGRAGAQGRAPGSTAGSARPWSRPRPWPTSPPSCCSRSSSRPASRGPGPGSRCSSCSRGWSALTAVAALAVGRSPRLAETVTRLQDTTAEIRVRAAVLLLVGFVALAARAGPGDHPRRVPRRRGRRARRQGHLARTRIPAPSSRPSATAS